MQIHLNNISINEIIKVLSMYCNKDVKLNINNVIASINDTLVNKKKELEINVSEDEFNEYFKDIFHVEIK